MGTHKCCAPAGCWRAAGGLRVLLGGLVVTPAPCPEPSRSDPAARRSAEPRVCLGLPGHVWAGFVPPAWEPSFVKESELTPLSCFARREASDGGNVLVGVAALI